MIRAGCLSYEISFADQPSIRQIDPYELDYHHNYQWDTFYSEARDNAKFYNENNATHTRLYLTPFNKQCLTQIDYCYLISIGVTLFSIIIFFCILLFNKILTSRRVGLFQTIHLFQNIEIPSHLIQLWEFQKNTKSYSSQLNENFKLKLQDAELILNAKTKKTGSCVTVKKFGIENQTLFNLGRKSLIVQVDKKAMKKIFEIRKEKQDCKTENKKRTVRERETNKVMNSFKKKEPKSMNYNLLQKHLKTNWKPLAFGFICELIFIGFIIFLSIGKNETTDPSGSTVTRTEKNPNMLEPKISSPSDYELVEFEKDALLMVYHQNRQGNNCLIILSFLDLTRVGNDIGVFVNTLKVLFFEQLMIDFNLT